MYINYHDEYYIHVILSKEIIEHRWNPRYLRLNKSCDGGSYVLNY